MTKILEVVYNLLRRAADGETLEESREEILQWLADEGISTRDADLALNIAIKIQDRVDDDGAAPQPIRSDRVFMDMERARFSTDALGYLDGMVQSGVIDAIMRDEVVNRALMSDVPLVDIRVCQSILSSIIEGQEWWSGPDAAPRVYH